MPPVKTTADVARARSTLRMLPSYVGQHAGKARSRNRGVKWFTMAGSLLGDEGPTLCRWARWRFATRSKTRSFLPDLPDGQITHFLSSPFRKNIPLSPSGKSALPARAIPFRKRGVGHVTNVGMGCGGRGSARDERANAY